MINTRKLYLNRLKKVLKKYLNAGNEKENRITIFIH